MDYNTLNVLSLAYLGDAIYEIYVRKYLIEIGISKVELLQKEAISVKYKYAKNAKYVSEKEQAKFLKQLIEKNFFDEEEQSIINRARNHKGNRHPKNTDIVTYKHSTGLEAVIGYLYLNSKIERINEIMDYILKGD